jgi:hypothetical protein
LIQRRKGAEPLEHNQYPIRSQAARLNEEDETAQRRGVHMVSPWWLLWAFLGGGFSGVLLMALVRVAAGPMKSALGAAESTERRTDAADAV